MMEATHIITPKGYKFDEDNSHLSIMDGKAVELYSISFWAYGRGFLHSQTVDVKYKKQAVANWNAIFSSAPNRGNV